MDKFNVINNDVLRCSKEEIVTEINNINDKIDFYKDNLDKVKLKEMIRIISYLLFISLYLGISILTFSLTNLSLISMFLIPISLVSFKYIINDLDNKKLLNLKQEEMHYEIELEKAKNKKDALNKSIDVLESNKDYIPLFSKEYFSSNGSLNEKEESTIVLEEKEKELDLVSTKKVLSNKLENNINNKKSKKELIISTSVLSLILLIVSIPSVLNTNLMGLFNGILPSLLLANTSALVLFIHNKNIKDNQNVYDSFVKNYNLENKESKKRLKDSINLLSKDVAVAKVQYEKDRFLKDDDDISYSITSFDNGFDYIKSNDKEKILVKRK